MKLLPTDKKFLVRSIASAMCLLLLALTGFGATLDDYKKKIESALSSATDLETELVDTGGDEEMLLPEFVGHVRKNFPTSERVEWRGGTAETVNEWLLGRADALEKANADERLKIVREVREYLSTVAFKLHELDNPSNQTRSKDEDKQKLSEILKRDEYQKPEPKQESAVTRWFREFLEWLDGLFPKPKPTTAGGGSGMALLVFVLQILLFVALIGLLVFLIVKLAPRFFPNLKRRRKPKKKSRVILGEQIAEDETANDILSEAERLARAGDLRGAIRKGYIALLCDLADRKVIGLSRHKTNRDYVRDVRSRRELHPRMKTVTDTFERHWYGSQESVEQDWARFRSEYNEAVRSV